MFETAERSNGHPRGTIPCGCLVLAGAVGGMPGELARALSAKGMGIEVVHDEPSVMVALSRAERTPGVLVVVDPGCWGRLAELSYALRTYHPDLLCWQYIENPAGAPRLTTLDQSVRGPKLTGGGVLGAADATGPIGRIVGRRRPVDALLVKVPGQPLTSSEIVTRQELTMLLGPTPGEAG